MNKKHKAVAQLAGVIMACAMLMLCCPGCKTCDPIAPPEIVYVTDYEAPTPLPLPPEPEYQLNSLTTEADWRAYLEAIGVDWTRSQEHIKRLRHIIESYNRAIEEREGE